MEVMDINSTKLDRKLNYGSTRSVPETGVSDNSLSDIHVSKKI